MDYNPGRVYIERSIWFIHLGDWRHLVILVFVILGVVVFSSQIHLIEGPKKEAIKMEPNDFILNSKGPKRS